MANKKTYKLTNLTIGSKVFVVHKHYVFEKKVGGRVIPARIVAFVNSNGKIIPEFKLIGSNITINEKTHILFTNIKEAINAIKS